MNSYARWVIGNPSGAKHVEDTAKWLSFLLPSGYGTESGGILSESAYAFVGLLGMYNDRLIASHANPSRTDKDTLLSAAQWSLTALASLDVVLEMLGSLNAGRSGRLTTIWTVESVRAALKLFVLHRSHGRHLLGGGQLVRPLLPPAPVSGVAADAEGAVPSPGPALASAAAAAVLSAELPQAPLAWAKGSRTGVCMAAPSGFVASTGCTVAGGLEQLAAPARAASELLHIARPLVYLLSRAVFGGRSWAPVVLSAGADVLSWRAGQVAEQVASGEVSPPHAGIAALLPLLLHSPAHTAASASGRDAGSLVQDLLATADRLPCPAVFKFIVLAVDKLTDISKTWTPAEAAEMSRRKRLWGLYFLQSPLFFAVTKPAADFVAFLFAWVPLLSMLFAYLRDMVCFYQRHYFYRSGSR